MFSEDDYIQILLNLQDVIVTNIKKYDYKLEIFLELPKKEHHCPKCKSPTNKVHDYYTRRVKDLPFADNYNVFLILRKRRYKCKECGKNFYEQNSFLPRFQRMTSRVPMKIVDSLRRMRTYSDIAKENHISIQTVLRIFDNVEYSKNTQHVFENYLVTKGILHSFSRRENPYDNACIESFHSVLKKEEIYLNTYQNFHEAKRAIFEYIESWYNRQRIHSAINYMTPQQKEETFKSYNYF